MPEEEAIMMKNMIPTKCCSRYSLRSGAQWIAALRIFAIMLAFLYIHVEYTLEACRKSKPDLHEQN